jgi:hypothetical protein
MQPVSRDTSFVNDTYRYQLIHTSVKRCLYCLIRIDRLDPMAKKDKADHQGTINIRGVPKELVYRMKQAALAERRTVKGFLLALAEERIQELEKKGLLPKGK